MPADQNAAASDTSSTVSNQQLNRYPNDWKCFHFKIQTWFYASLGTLCCFCTVRIADYILTLTYIQSASPESKSFNLSRFHGILSFDALQVLSIILLGAYGTYRMNSKLIGTYLMLQVSFLAVNGFLLVYWIIDIWPSDSDNKDPTINWSHYLDYKQCGFKEWFPNKTKVDLPEVKSILESKDKLPTQLCVCDNYIKGSHKSSFLCMMEWSELLLTIFNTSSCIWSIIMGALVFRMFHMVKDKHPITGRNQTLTRHHPHNNNQSHPHIYPHNQLLDESMTNMDDEDSSNFDSQYS